MADATRPALRTNGTYKLDIHRLLELRDSIRVDHLNEDPSRLAARLKRGELTSRERIFSNMVLVHSQHDEDNGRGVLLTFPLRRSAEAGDKVFSIITQDLKDYRGPVKDYLDDELAKLQSRIMTESEYRGWLFGPRIPEKVATLSLNSYDGDLFLVPEFKRLFPG